MKQKDLILAYVKEYGSIVPAKMGGKEWRDGFFGSETSKRCREMRKAGILVSEPEGKFERFRLAPMPKVEPAPVAQSALFNFTVPHNIN